MAVSNPDERIKRKDLMLNRSFVMTYGSGVAAAGGGDLAGLERDNKKALLHALEPRGEGGCGVRVRRGRALKAV
jgi:hypothetical protein